MEQLPYSTLVPGEVAHGVSILEVSFCIAAFNKELYMNSSR